MAAPAPGITPVFNTKGERAALPMSVLFYSGEQELSQNLPAGFFLYFMVQDSVTNLILAAKETDKVSIEMGTSSCQIQLAPVSKKDGRMD